ncbi:MAG TPA: signal peptide peptidase SppA [Acidobacteriaceae bacterium]|nr:signal peptide peptidase SppA [Acidobacteriaceae bacterium]
MDDPGPQPPASEQPALPPQPPYPGPSWQVAPPPPPQRRHRVWPWVLAGCAFFLLLCAVGITVMVLAIRSAGTPGASPFASLGGGNIAVVDINGVILSADTTVDQLRKYDEDDSIKAIILHINSPGGAAAPSQEIYHEVLRIRNEKKKPIVASVQSVGASGAYYIASGATKIYANQASVVGSIGVIMEWTNYGDLLKWAKLKPEVIHAGALKDAGDPSHEMTPEERAYFQSLVNNMYGQFIADVAAGRHLSPDQVKSLATGQVWTGEQALPLHLIDASGGFRTALLETAKSVGISGEPSVVKPYVRHRSLLDALTTNADDLFPNPSQMLEKHAGFYFLWR